MPLDLLDRLRSFPLFQTAPEEFLSAVATHLRPQLHSPRDYILTEGDHAKAMYWLVRGAVAVTSRDGESTYAELRPGAFFGEIGILMNIPRTATIIARSRCLLVVLTKEALQRELPKFPEVERAIREEAEERLTLLNKKKKERETTARSSGVKRPVDDGEMELDEQPLQGLTPGGQWASASALASVAVNIRQLLMELPLFANLPPENLHFLGLSAQPRAFDPFTNIIQQNSHGREIYFIVRGEVEVVDESDPAAIKIKARLKKGQYFGEVAGLSLAPKRTATVRSVTYVECLVIFGDVLAELWKQCPAEIQQQLEKTARTRMIHNHAPPPHLSLSLAEAGDSNVVEPFDPDPYLATDFDAMVRSKSRRGSLAPPTPSGASSPTEDKGSPLSTPSSSPAGKTKHASTPPEKSPAKRPKTSGVRVLSRKPSRFNIGQFDDDILNLIFLQLSLPELMRLRAVSTHWCRLLTYSSHLLKVLDLTPYNRIINDRVLIECIAPFVGHRPHTVDISHCFHISDEGFTALANLCGHNVRRWIMKSVWDITGQAILEMSQRARGLEVIDLSNCRKVSDTLLARVVGWVVPEIHPLQQQRYIQLPPPGTVIGCPNLRSLTLSYCKHVTDRTMQHLAAHASKRLEHVDLTRCTTITDLGFQAWSLHKFDNLKSLCLADCTYLTDSAVVFLTNAAKGLRHLDLVPPPTLTRALASACPASDQLTG
jgi:F-box/leucine-rich repeat protein 7